MVARLWVVSLLGRYQEVEIITVAAEIFQVVGLPDLIDIVPGEC